MKYSHTCSPARSALSVCFAYFPALRARAHIFWFPNLTCSLFSFHVFCGSIKGGNGREIEYIEVSHNASYDFTAVSHVRFRQLSDEVINEYLSLVPVLDKAGAYGIQEYGDMLVESLDGELENVIGLPVEKLKQAFDLLGIAYKH